MTNTDINITTTTTTTNFNETELLNKNDNNSNNNIIKSIHVVKTIELSQTQLKLRKIGVESRQFQQILNCLNAIKNLESCKDIPLSEFNSPWATSTFKQPCLACHYFGHLIKNCVNLQEKIEDSCLRCFSKEHQVAQCNQKEQSSFIF
ncbi:hypothetical protein Glove_33g88 [Diversispora epigaea]|uniref:CCHC-type domain-containing protein n=1 Tax=Diversispora epigaea TaxID=1348612 RepID=A0A397JNW3_9GLOM|nr:hypothetical protein Glove_33g88 [Diversispora epigaea]